MGQFIGKRGEAVKVRAGDVLAAPCPAADEVYYISSSLIANAYREQTDDEEPKSRAFGSGHALLNRSSHRSQSAHTFGTREVL